MSGGGRAVEACKHLTAAIALHLRQNTMIYIALVLYYPGVRDDYDQYFALNADFYPQYTQFRYVEVRNGHFSLNFAKNMPLTRRFYNFVAIILDYQ